MTSLPARVGGRVRRVAAFASAGPSPSQWGPLALLGWARDNPGSAIGRWRRVIHVRPSALAGGPVAVDATDLGQLMSFEEVFVQRVYDLAAVPFVPTAVLDCGAHVGYFSALAGAAYPRVPVIAVEPNPDNIDALRGNLAALGPRVTIHSAACATREGTAAFGGASSNAGRLLEPGGGGIDVRTLDLAALISRAPDAALILKMDIEGEERRLLPHVLPLLPRRCAVFVETHDGRAAREQLAGHLVRHGFRVDVRRTREPYADLCAVRARD